MKSDAQKIREEETGVKTERRFDAKTGKIVIEGTIYKEVEPAPLISMLDSLKKQREDISKVVDQMTQQVEEGSKVKESKDLIAWVKLSEQAAALSKKLSAEKGLAERKKEIILIDADIEELSAMLELFNKWKEGK